MVIPRTLAIIICIGTLSSLAMAAAPPASESARESSARSTTAPSTSPATRPVAALLVGTYRGIVVDDDETVPCITTFRDDRGRISGTYVVREGADRYDGSLDRFELLSDERGECRFRWRDKHGTGLVTVRVTPDGSRFEGSWGLEVVQAQLIWTGTRQSPTSQRARGSY